jgi:hypothetical protein
MWRQIAKFNNSIYLQRSPNFENAIVNEPKEEEYFLFNVPNKFFFLLNLYFFFYFF